MKVLAVIPARYASSRFPGKVLAPIAGKPMIQRVWERTRQAERIDQVVVATDDERVAEAVARFGGEAVMTRADHVSGTSRVSEVAERLDAEIVVNVQGDEPLIHPESLDLVVGPFYEEEGVSMASLQHPLVSYSEYIDPNVVKVVCDDMANALYFSRSPLPCYREGAELLKRWEAAGVRPAELVPLPMKHIGVYAYRAEFLQAVSRFPACELERAEKLEQLRVLAWGFKVRMVTSPHDSVSVDVPADALRVEAIIQEKGWQ